MSRPGQRKVVVVVGCGFAGTACIRQLARIMRHRLDIIAFDKQPALYNYPALPRLLNEPLRSGQVEVPYSKLFAGIDIDFRQ